MYEVLENKIKNLEKNLDIISDYVIFSRTDLKGVIKEASNAFCQISKYTKEELIGQPHNIIRHPDVPSKTFEEMWNTIQSGNVWRGEVKNLKKDGTYYWVDAHVSPEYNENGEIESYIAVRYDITAKKDFEQQHQQLVQLEKMASIGEMIANIAHQWRQPLSIISTASSGIKIQKKHNMLQDDFLINSCDTINKNAQYLSRTIDDFRNFIKGERQKKEFFFKNTMDTFLFLVDSTVKSHSIRIILDVKKDLKINGYENELIQCIMNLFNNAKDALEKNKEENRIVFISSAKQNKSVVIKIKDNAGGIPKNVLPQIFEPYFTTKHKSRGTGLGLHMTYTLIVKGFKGTIVVKNTEFSYMNTDYRGAEFIITIPMGEY